VNVLAARRARLLARDRQGKTFTPKRSVRSGERPLGSRRNLRFGVVCTRCLGRGMRDHPEPKTPIVQVSEVTLPVAGIGLVCTKLDAPFAVLR